MSMLGEAEFETTKDIRRNCYRKGLAVDKFDSF